ALWPFVRDSGSFSFASVSGTRGRSIAASLASPAADVHERCGVFLFKRIKAIDPRLKSVLSLRSCLAGATPCETPLLPFKTVWWKPTAQSAWSYSGNVSADFVFNRYSTASVAQGCPQRLCRAQRRASLRFRRQQWHRRQ